MRLNKVQQFIAYHRMIKITNKNMIGIKKITSTFGNLILLKFLILIPLCINFLIIIIIKT